MTASTRRELRSAATSTSTTAIDLIRALTDARPIKPTSTRCLSARRPNPGRGSTYRRGNSVQTTAATSVIRRRFLSSLVKYLGEVRLQRSGIGRLTAEADIAVGTDHIQTCIPSSIAVVQLAPRIQKYFAFAYQVLGELVWDDQVRFDAVWVRVHGCIGQGLQSPVRF